MPLAHTLQRRVLLSLQVLCVCCFVTLRHGCLRLCKCINSVVEVFENPHLKARGAIEHHRLESGKELYMPATVQNLSHTLATTLWLGPKLGAHNQEILEDIGLNDEQINRITGGESARDTNG